MRQGHRTLKLLRESASPESDMTTAMKVRGKVFLSSFGSCEVGDQRSSAGLQNPSYLAGKLLASFAGQVMEHHSGQHSVELGVWKRQRLGSSMSKDNFDAGRGHFVDPSLASRAGRIPFAVSPTLAAR